MTNLVCLTCILEVPEGMEQEDGLEGLLSKSITENFPDIQVHEANRTPNAHDQKQASQ